MSIFNKKKNRNQEKTDVVPYDSAISAKETLLDCLSQLNCKCEKEETDNSKDIYYLFGYQGKTFRAQLHDKKELVTIIYPSFYTTGIDNLNIVREMTNNYNGACYIHKLLYTIDSDYSQVLVHGEVAIERCTVGSLCDIFNVFFSIQHDFTYSMEKAISTNRGGFFQDLEYHRALDDREMVISRELEIKHQPTKCDCRSNHDFNFTLEEYMDMACRNIAIKDYNKLKIVTGDELAVYDDATFIKTLPMHYALIETAENDLIQDASVEAKFLSQSAVMIVEFTDSEDCNHTLTINLEACGEDKVTLYYRAFSMPCPENVGRDNPLSRNNSMLLSEVATSLMLAYDKTNVEKKLQEFDFMWKEAQDKLRDNDNSLTDADIMLGTITEPHVGLNYYWGRRCMAMGCYAQALKHFLNAYHVIKSSTDSKVSDVRASLCYSIGYCYCELGMHDRAYYYLESLRNSGEIKHLVELVNVLANAGDMRVFHYIDSYMKTAIDFINQAEGDVEEVEVFISFLKRRHAYCLINIGKIDEAEKEFKELLDDPRSNEYALNELAYIQQLRKRAHSHKDEENPQSDDTATNNKIS